MQRALAAVCSMVLLACGSSAPGGTEDGGAPQGEADADPDASLRGDAPRADDAANGDAEAASDASAGADAGADPNDAQGGQTPDGASGGTGPYGGNGPETVATVTQQVPGPNGSFTVTGYYPQSQKRHPAVILSSGFFQTGPGYAPYAERLASWGIVTFTRDDPGLSESAPAVAADVAYMVATWLPALDADAAPPAFGLVDTARIGLAGHSRGGQVALLAAEGGAHGLVRGVFGLDPVDTSTNGSPQARAQIAGIGVPLAFVGETTDSATNGCAPGTDNYEVLYQAAASPAVAITGANADHTMFEDPAACTFCTLCTAGTAKPATVLAYSVRYLTAFFARELLGDASVGAAFGGAGAAQDVAAGLVTVVSK